MIIYFRYRETTEHGIGAICQDPWAKRHTVCYFPQWWVHCIDVAQAPLRKAWSIYDQFVKLGMLKVSLAFAKSICLLYTEEIAEHMASDPNDYFFPYINESAPFPRWKRNIEAATIT